MDGNSDTAPVSNGMTFKAMVGWLHDKIATCPLPPSELQQQQMGHCSGFFTLGKQTHAIMMLLKHCAPTTMMWPYFLHLPPDAKPVHVLPQPFSCLFAASVCGLRRFLLH